MEDSKELTLKLVFVLPSILSFITAIYSFIYWDDLISKILTVHLACVSCLPALLEFSPLFRNNLIPDMEKFDSNFFRVGIILYICIATSIFGVGILASISAIISLVAGLGLLLYQFKHQILEKFGLSSGLQTLEEV